VKFKVFEYAPRRWHIYKFSRIEKGELIYRLWLEAGEVTPFIYYSESVALKRANWLNATEVKLHETSRVGR
jgi:hypothetical protein